MITAILKPRVTAFWTYRIMDMSCVAICWSTLRAGGRSARIPLFTCATCRRIRPSRDHAVQMTRRVKHGLWKPGSPPVLVRSVCPGILTCNRVESSRMEAGFDILVCIHKQHITHSVPANTRYSPDADSMLGQRRRRWASIETALGG